MAIISKDTTKKITIDLTGPQGNSFYLMGVSCNLMKQLDFTPEEGESVFEELKSGDYEHLIKTFDKYFGDFIDLER
jgi:hypothetical protein